MNYRPRYSSLLIVMVLSLINILFTFFLLQSKTCSLTTSPQEPIVQLKPRIITTPAPPPPPQPHRNNNLSQQEEEPNVQCMPQNYDSFADEHILDLNIQFGKWDNRRLYKSFDSVLIGTKFLELTESNAVCLATQSSLEKLYSLVQVAHHWTGPISVAIFAAGDEEFEALQKYLSFLRKCYVPILERINFSLAVPKLKMPIKQPQNYNFLNYDCTRPEATLSSLLNEISEEHTNWRIRNVYPQNHMRNLARKNCQTEWVFLTDVDIIPSVNLADSLHQFLRDTDNCDKCAYVVPTYEIDIRVKFPANKSELMRLSKKGLARPFHWKVFIHNQYATNFTRWVLDVSPGSKDYKNVVSGKTYVSHNVTNFEFLYEPFYVSKDTAPPHDERFLGYGYTRNTQVYEMFVAGYQFKVLSPVFTVHWGLQSRRNRSVWRERQNILNRLQFEQFKKEVYIKYMQKT